ncbi:MAG: metallophosphoesterase family protein [Candidatus Thorarchaeota archaeon]
MRIAHISDSHLGCSLFQLAERREDARRGLKKAVDMAMQHSPDILVHTGDLFHSPLPQNDDMIFVIELFKDLKDKVKLIVLDGNHDIPYGYRYNFSPLRGLEIMDLIVSTGNGPYSTFSEEFDGKKVEMHLLSWTSKHQFEYFLNSAKTNGGISLFFAHDIPVMKEDLPAHFNYYGCGHKHNFWLDQEFDIGRPGSTGIVNWNREMGGKKKLIIVDIDNSGMNEYTLQTLNDVREFKFITGLDITGMGMEEVNQTLKNSLGKLVPKKKKPIIIVEVNGLIDTETERGIQRKELIEYGEKKLDPLFLHIEPNWSSVGPRPVTLSKPLDVEASILEYMQQTNDTHAAQIKELMPRFFGGEEL